MRVDLGCRNALVSEKLLNNSEVGTSFKKVGRVAMPECVRGDALFYSCLPHGRHEGLSDVRQGAELPSDRIFSLGWE